MAKVLKATNYNLNLCKQALVNSKVIAVPTETVYGLAGNALDEVALHTIFKIKGRPLFNPLILHTDSMKNAENYGIFNSLARRLADHFWPGPLTIILPKKDIVPCLATANLDSVAIRCPQNPTFLDLLKRLPFPLAAPSANPFGYVSPTTAEHVNSSLGDKLEFILNGCGCSIGIESTIVDLRNPDKPKVLRPGPISMDALEQASGTLFEKAKTASKNELRAPGMLKSHYSPNTLLEITTLDQLKRLINSKNQPAFAFIFQKHPGNLVHKNSTQIYWLSKNGNPSEMAQNFYQILRTTDEMNYKKIYIEEINENEGLKEALKDRLTKAASKEAF